MATRCSFYAFDWDRLQSSGPAIQLASQTGEWADLHVSTDCAAAIDDLGPDAEPATLAALAVVDLCVVGEPVSLDTGVPKLLRHMRCHRDGEDAAELLALAVMGRANLGGWLSTDAELAGILAPHQTRQLSRSLSAFCRSWRPAPPRGLVALARRFAAGEPAEVRLGDLLDLVTTASEAGQGLAALIER